MGVKKKNGKVGKVGRSKTVKKKSTKKKVKKKVKKKAKGTGKAKASTKGAKKAKKAKKTKRKSVKKSVKKLKVPVKKHCKHQRHHKHRRKKGSTFIGFCRCGCMIMDGDKVKVTIYVCPGCGKRESTKKLKENTSTESQSYTSKKDYLNHVVEHKVLDGGV